MAATGLAAVPAVTVNPGGAAVAVSPCDIQTCWVSGRPSSSAPPSSRSCGSGSAVHGSSASRPPGCAVSALTTLRVSSALPGDRISRVAPYSPEPVWLTVPPRAVTMSWKP